MVQTLAHLGLVLLLMIEILHDLKAQALEVLW